MSIIVIAKMDTDSKVYMAYDINTGKSDIVRGSQLLNYNCLNFKSHKGKIEYTQGKSESRLPLASDLSQGHFCYILYKIKNERNISLGFRVLNAVKGKLEVVDLTVRETVKLINNSTCVNAKVIHDKQKVFVSAFKNNFEVLRIDTKETKVNSDLSHEMRSIQEKYAVTYKQVQKLNEDELNSLYDKIPNITEENKARADFVTKRMKKKSRVSNQIRVAMVSCLAVVIIGGAASAGLGYSQPMLNKQEVSIEVSGKLPVDTESTRIRLLNAKEISATFEGDIGKLYVDGIAIANIKSTLNNSVNEIVIADLNNNIIHSSSSETWSKEQKIYSNVKGKNQETLKMNMNLSGMFGKSLEILDNDNSKIAEIKSTKYLNGLRYRIVDENGHELYKFSGSKLTDKSFQIKKENIVSDISMLDALVIAGTYNTQIDDAKYE